MPYYDETDKAASYQRAYDRHWTKAELRELDEEQGRDREQAEHDLLDEQVHQAEMQRDDEC